MYITKKCKKCLQNDKGVETQIYHIGSGGCRVCACMIPSYHFLKTAYYPTLWPAMYNLTTSQYKILKEYYIIFLWSILIIIVMKALIISNYMYLTTLVLQVIYSSIKIVHMV